MPRTNAHPEQLAHVEQLLDHFEQLETQFQVLRDGLTHSHRLATIGTIASMVAHEYNNILTPIITYAQLALSRPDDHDLLIRAVQKALSGAERAASISASMLGFAREDDSSKTADLPGVIEDAVACLGRDPAKDGITLTIQTPQVTAAMPALNLQQVFVNLLLNARQAMRRKGGRITITGRVVDHSVYLAVSDTGPGIPPHIMETLFEPFVTSRDETTGSERKGTGLGLCICRDLMRKAGGSIEVSSEPGQGTTFHLCLPLAEMTIETT